MLVKLNVITLSHYFAPFLLAIVLKDLFVEAFTYVLSRDAPSITEQVNRVCVSFLGFVLSGLDVYHPSREDKLSPCRPGSGHHT